MGSEFKQLNRINKNEINAQTRVSEDSFWFRGHFPGEPVLPGIAQLGLVIEAIRQSLDTCSKITGVRRVRFKQMIRPGDPINIRVTPHKNQIGEYAFRITVENELVCSGRLSVA